MDGSRKLNLVIDKIVSFFKLIRIANLLIMVATLFLLRYMVVRPMLANYDLYFQLSLSNFILLSFAVVLIAAGGNVINDYFDVKIDLFNRPEGVVISKKITRREAIVLHIVFSALGIIIGSYVSYICGMFYFSIIFIVVSVILWFYSAHYKKQLLVGNLVVASLTAIIPFLVIVYEIPLQYRNNWQFIIINGIELKGIILIITAFAFFSFLTNLIREIVKDVEDYEGDNAFGCNTLPIALGVKSTKYIISGLILVLIASIAFSIFYLTHLRFVFFEIVYAGVGMVFPLIYMMIRIIKAKVALDYKYAGDLAKYIMLAGLLFTLIIKL